MSERSGVAHSRDTLPMAVANMTFIVNRLGEDCAPLQYIRELTQNAMESLQMLDPPRGEVVWDVFWPYMDLDDHSTCKLACIDTGVGMTGEEMVQESVKGMTREMDNMREQARRSEDRTERQLGNLAGLIESIRNKLSDMQRKK